jgi:hypothetical protein
MSRLTWPVGKLGNAEPVKPRQARPDDDTAVAVMTDLEGKERYFRFDFVRGDQDFAVERARQYALRKVEEGFAFVSGDIGYVAESGKDYTRTGSWGLESPFRKGN